MKIILPLLSICFFQLCFAQTEAPFKKNETYTFDQATEHYQALEKGHPESAKFLSFGSSDYGKPVGLFLINANGDFSETALRKKSVLLINNAIHPGEPCGVDASIMLADKLLTDKSSIPENVIIAIIPLYNVGGAHNRNCCSRANQNGPVEYGFRGNAKNLDLNRDFIKCDSKNTIAFHQIFHFLKPSIFIDTHTSNGADYQHVLTLITSQLDKMNPELKAYTKEHLNPYLFNKMEEDSYPMVPYVHSIKSTPDDGIMDYLETPRYSTGYTNLFNTISYVTEAHMLKTYEQRVLATHAFLKNTINYMGENHIELEKARTASKEELMSKTWFPINWQMNKKAFDTIPFMGYTASYKPSKVTGSDRLYYDRNQPYKKYIKYYNRFTVKDSVKRPKFYVIPQAWDNIILLLNQNDVPIYRLLKDQEIAVEQYEILKYDTKKSPYEGHYLHTNIHVVKQSLLRQYRKGDYIIPAEGNGVRYIIETLEPHASDSYFAWNYFDAILQQKEWFSAYVFEDEAALLLQNNKELKAEFEAQKKTDTTFAKNDFAQLYFIYKNSPNYEGSTNVYPVTRGMNELPTNSYVNVSKILDFK